MLCMDDSSQATSLGGATQADFMARVRAALGRSPSQPTPVPPPPPAVPAALVRLAGPDEDLPARFTLQAHAVGIEVRPIAGSDLVKSVLRIVDELGAKRVLTGVGTLPQALGLNDALRRKGVTVIDWRASPGFGVQYDADLGVTDVHAAIAESGTLVCQSDAGHSRGLSLVPPVHVAVVRREDVLPDLVDFFARSGALPSSVALITGPSKTADIEGVLITGVHGPGRVIVLLVG